ncbi:MAG TPA: lipid-binding SYLF domain-containing protein [Candidatus Acidoferrales bacterium]|nr:lipid-binding SYLF domain-containing protein [Candidatus Acidoferrales bacterium]
MMLLKRWAIVMIGILVFASVTFARDNDQARKEENRIANSSVVMGEILNVPDNIPQDLLDKARCVVVIPSVLKAAFIVGADYGRGTMVCRSGKDFSGPWGAPAMYALEGGSIGFQAGGEATDYVLLIMNNRGANSLLHSKVKLGGDASIAGGPVGRTAAADTDAFMLSEILSYSRARGVFAGISLEGSTLRPDNRANRNLYGRSVTAEQIVRESEVNTPPIANNLTAQLQTASPHLRS